jgi:hypothetical protein
MINQERAQYMHKDATIDLGADSKLLISLYGRIAQLVRALASHARGRRFESYCDHQIVILPSPKLSTKWLEHFVILCYCVWHSPTMSD